MPDLVSATKIFPGANSRAAASIFCAGFWGSAPGANATWKINTPILKVTT